MLTDIHIFNNGNSLSQQSTINQQTQTNMETRNKEC